MKNLLKTLYIILFGFIFVNFAFSSYKIEIEPNDIESFSYKSIDDIELSDSMKTYLDLVSYSLNTNYKLKVQIYGHSSETIQNGKSEEMSFLRTKNAIDYLKNKSISLDRILVSNYDNIFIFDKKNKNNDNLLRIQILENEMNLNNFQIDRGVNYPGFTKQDLTNVPEISYVAIPEIVEQVKEEPVFADEHAKDIKVVKTEEKIKILTTEEAVKLKTILYFSDTQIQLNQQMKDYLASVAVYLNEHPKATVLIDTHTDNSGQPEEIKKKSDDRANAALKYLQSKTISRTRIFAKGNGDIKPVGDNKTDEGRRKNRRIEIIVRP
ncbi:MAG: OmpA family protein [Candidatus Kapabacteria bacterium]|nr:OmpA family protein [Candidatus Kapabacteria bacterium]